MDELENQRDQKLVSIQIRNKTYNLTNSDKDGADQLQDN